MRVLIKITISLVLYNENLWVFYASNGFDTALNIYIYSSLCTAHISLFRFAKKWKDAECAWLLYLTLFQIYFQMEMCTLFALCYISSFVLLLTRYRCTTVWRAIFLLNLLEQLDVFVLCFFLLLSISFSPFRSIGRLLFNTCQNPSCKALNFVFFFSDTLQFVFLYVYWIDQ